MGTQAVVSVVKNGNTLIKCVTGCNGHRAGKLAKVIAERHLQTVESVHDVAASVHYGCSDCTITQDKKRMLGADVEDLVDSLYVSKFADPTFNPRWERGIAAYVFTIDADTWQITDVNGGEDDD